MRDLFSSSEDSGGRHEIAEDAYLLPGYATSQAIELCSAIDTVLLQSPLRHYQTRMGLMSVGMSCCGALGWVADTRGYRYSALDPNNGQPWPGLPDSIRNLAQSAASDCGFDGFEPDACLINEYQLGAKMGLHQDRDERDMRWPIVSISLGMTAQFQFGGATRRAPVHRFDLVHGDVLVWGGRTRLNFHGVAPLDGSPHPLLGARRWNLTLRRAG